MVEALPIDNSLKKNILKFVLGSSLDLDLKLTIPKFLCFFKLCQTSGKWYLHIIKTPSPLSMYYWFTKQVSLSGLGKKKLLFSFEI